jgi:hypothetical protein
LVELTRSFTAIAGYFEAGDVTGAINELINIPANVTNAVLNGGGVLDLTGVVNAIQPLPKEVKSIGLNLGGLISPPVPQDGSLLPNGTAPTQFNGGVLFDSLAVEIDYKVSNLPPPNGTVVNVKDPGIPVSWVGAVVGLGQYLSDEMLVTPPAPPAPPAQAAAVEGEAVEAAPVVAEVADSAPAVPDADVAEVADDAAPAVVDVPEVEAAPADVAEDPAPKPAASIGSDDAGDTGSRAGDSRRGADDAD